MAWVPPEANAEARILLHMVYFGNEIIKYWEWSREVGQRRNKVWVFKPVSTVGATPLETLEDSIK